MSELKASAMALRQYMQDLIGEKAGDQCGCIRAGHGRAGVCVVVGLPCRALEVPRRLLALI